MLGCLLISCDSAYYDLMPDRFIWTLDRKTTHTSLIEFIQNILNLNWLDALATLADILGMNYENIFFFFVGRLYPRNRCSLWGDTGHN